MSKKPDVFDFEWVMYVDAAGDDGSAYDRGSSTTYTVNCFMCETAKIQHNRDVLDEVKKILRCRLTDEAKSAAIIRSNRRADICNKLSELDGALFQFVIYKQMLDFSSLSPEEKKQHPISTAAHAFTINLATSFHKHNNKSLCIVIDNMKEAEILGTKEQVEAQLSDLKHAIIFSDSKSEKHCLLQISDYFAGITNRACAEQEAFFMEKPGYNRCSPCAVVRNLCRGKPEMLRTPLFAEIQRFRNLYVLWNNRPVNTLIGNGIQMSPERIEKMYRFVDCAIIKGYRRQNK